MIELFIDSLTLNSLGLIVLGFGILASHFWNNRKLSRDSNIIVIDGIRESIFSKLFKARSLVAGVLLLMGGASLIVFNYNQRIADYYFELIDETYKKVMSSTSHSVESREALREMEGAIPLSFLSKHIALEIEEWNSSKNYLAAINQDKPLCIKLYEMYWKKDEMRKVINLELIYDKFFKDYYGETQYLDAIRGEFTREALKRHGNVHPINEIKDASDF